MSVAITLAAAAAVLIILAAVGLVVVAALLASAAMARRPHPDLRVPQGLRALYQEPDPFLMTPTVEDVAMRLASCLLQGVNVLLAGERGVGKSVMFERAVTLAHGDDVAHESHSGAVLRSDRALSDLFGHEEGAFTDAKGTRAGLFERLEGGVLFIDELHRLPDSAQAMLLKATGGGGYRRVGGAELRQVQTRIVSATNVDLDQLVERDAFAADLRDRLVGDVITIPPLRERRGEAVAIAHEAFRLWEVKRPLPDGWHMVVMSYGWPGNVRELIQTLRRSIHPIERTFSLGALIEAIDRGDDAGSIALEGYEARWRFVRDELDRQGRRDFTTSDWREWTGCSPSQAGADLRRARSAGWISSMGEGPARVHVVEKKSP